MGGEGSGGRRVGAGRKPDGVERKMYATRLDRNTIALIRDEAESSGTSQGEFIKRLVTGHLKQKTGGHHD